MLKQIVDFHTHILPGIDDGSKSVDCSLEMLKEEKEQGIKTLVFSSHFNAMNESVDDFILRRQKAFDSIKNVCFELGITTFLGAEIKYFKGISKSEEIKKLCIGNTKFLLLEMPYYKWNDFDVEEILSLRTNIGVLPVLAHIERSYKANKKAIERLAFEGVNMQMNAEYFLSYFTKKKAASFVEKGWVNFIGSDCHNTSSRKPNIMMAIPVLEKYCSPDALDQMYSFQTLIK